MSKSKPTPEAIPAGMAADETSKPRYQVLHTFAHQGELIGPWNAAKVASLPAETIAQLLARKRIREVS